jgi:propanol-preferring alcohol dehydrogenase
MQAAIYDSTTAQPDKFLSIQDGPRPQLLPGHVLIRLLARGVCRTDLHIVQGDLPPLQARIIPGHQPVGEDGLGSAVLVP